jgi:hypothetical protein
MSAYDIPLDQPVHLYNIEHKGLFFYQSQHSHFVIADIDKYSDSADSIFIINKRSDGLYTIESKSNPGNHVFGNNKAAVGLYTPLCDDQLWYFGSGSIYDGVKIINNRYKQFLAGKEGCIIYANDCSDQYWKIQLADPVVSAVYTIDASGIEKQLGGLTPVIAVSIDHPYKGAEYHDTSTLEYSYTTSNTFESSVGVTVTEGVEATVGVEGIGSAKSSLSVSTSYTTTTSNTFETTTRVSDTIDYKITAKTGGERSVMTLKQGPVDLPYKAVITYKSNKVVNDSGIYKGTACVDITSYNEKM